MKLPLAITLALLLGLSALAQDADTDVPPEARIEGVPPGFDVDALLERLQQDPPSTGPDTPTLPDPDALPDMPPLPPLGDEEAAAVQDSEEAAEAAGPDYSQLSRAEERRARLDDMFARLAEAGSEAQAKLIAEEIWAVWARSGSASVDFVLRRAATAQTRGQMREARAMFDTVTTLEPGFAEGWARSGRLALEERDFSRAVGDSIRALREEPRHYYALWTLGTVLERMGRKEEALEAYRESQSLYPELSEVGARIDALEAELGGGVL